MKDEAWPPLVSATRKSDRDRDDRRAAAAGRRGRRPRRGRDGDGVDQTLRDAGGGEGAPARQGRPPGGRVRRERDGRAALLQGPRRSAMRRRRGGAAARRSGWLPRVVPVDSSTRPAARLSVVRGVGSQGAARGRRAIRRTLLGGTRERRDARSCSSQPPSPPRKAPPCARATTAKSHPPPSSTALVSVSSLSSRGASAGGPASRLARASAHRMLIRLAGRPGRQLADLKTVVVEHRDAVAAGEALHVDCQVVHNPRDNDAQPSR